jgi:cobalt-zinc-cadmium resistance protein CzcA
VPVGTVPGELKLLLATVPGDSAVKRHPLMRAAQEQERAAEARWRSERSSMLPGITLGVSSMTLNESPSVPDGAVIYDRGDRFTTVKAGLGVPLAFGAQDARTKAARIDHERAVNEVDVLELELRTHLQQLRERYAAQLGRVDALELGGAQEAAQLRKASEEAFINGQIDRLEWSLLNGQAIDLTLEHLDALLALGRISIELDLYNEQ